MNMAGQWRFSAFNFLSRNFDYDASKVAIDVE